MDPIDLLKICGVDMTKPEPVVEALDVFASYVEELEKLPAEAYAQVLKLHKFDGK